MAEQSAEAIVLRRTNSGESDRRLTLLTREFGKIDVIARGARKGGSRLAGSSEPLVHGKVTIASGRVRKFLTQVQPITSYPNIRAEYDRLLAGLAFSELVATVLPYESADDPHFELVLVALNNLNEAERWIPVLAWAESVLLEMEGRCPDWTRCQDTGETELESPSFVSPIAGGRVSREAARNRPDAYDVRPECLIALNKMPPLREPPKALKYGDECLGILHDFWQAVTEGPLKAGKAVIDHLAHQAARPGSSRMS